QPADARVGDGLPETLEEVIAAYGHQHFKIKVGGDLKADLDRLKAISSVLDRSGLGYLATLDGNEQFEDVEGVVELLSAIASEPALARLNRCILFIEQPLHRSVALERDVTELGRHLPVIVDESDATLASFAEARQRGYAGISSKDCKGFYKSLINLARCRIYSGQHGRTYFMSAEDLTCQAGIAVQQDLALVALLGLGHVERNGHHYVNGMAGAPDVEQARFLEHHPDLYRRVGGRVCTHIKDGKFSIASLQCTGFGTAIEPDWTAMREMKTTPDAGNQNNQRST
ncbi:MAG: enolase C-terminal domain-like protein, partial [Rhodospirillales bacterium]